MQKRVILLAVAAALACPSVGFATPAEAAEKASNPIAAAVADHRRSEANRARDSYRHPIQTLEFFEVRPNQTVLEYNPGGGWYTEILAPLLKAEGHYIAYGSTRGEAPTKAMLAAKTDWFGTSPRYIVFDPTTGNYPEPGTVDRVLTFRNVHNLLMAGDAQAAAAFRAFYAALKPGGILGIVDHRLPEEADNALERSSGYIKRSTILRLAEAAGFKLAGESNVNANPKDDHDHPNGVWSLPPTYQGGDTDRAKYQAIGESDRLTLKFVKPK
ncbi:class I SAM-dependent methyltransferase [Flavisphingomonas formosensis]|uniref:class I SAM-dependent methyltransferase n=1 Tax=Flavisphingomonas formosensis TaxID=861534 RepID=UPI001E359C39|nr:methyltransferase [Sphingomonas formosensis]